MFSRNPLIVYGNVDHGLRGKADTIDSSPELDSNVSKRHLIPVSNVIHWMLH